MSKEIVKLVHANKFLKRIVEYLVITIASILYGIGISNFLDPNNLAPGGVTGLAIILNRIIWIPTGTWILLLNVPIMILGLWKFGFKFIVSTMYCIVLTTVFTNYFSKYGAVTDDKMLAALIGGVIVAVAMGIIFKVGSTTGGTDIIVKLLRMKFKYLKTGSLFFITDMIIVAISGLVFQNIETALYAGISCAVISFVFDMVLYGRDGAKMIYIISNHAQNITERFLLELDIGVTHMQGTGAFSGHEKTVILAVMKKTLSPQAEQIVREEDPDAFMIVTDATEIYGEGYKNIFSEKI